MWNSYLMKWRGCPARLLTSCAVLAQLPNLSDLGLFIQNTGHLARNRRTERSNTWHSPDTVRASAQAPAREGLTASAAATARIPHRLRGTQRLVPLTPLPLSGGGRAGSQRGHREVSARLAGLPFRLPAARTASHGSLWPEFPLVP